jgi:hypothetical protein
MILDILFYDMPPRQIQNVRMVTLYLDWDEDVAPSIAIHSNEYTKGMESFDLALIKQITYTND